MVLHSINPATGKNIQDYEETSPEEVRQIIEKVHHTYLEWKLSDFANRSRRMKKVAQILRDRASEYGALMALEMGKPVKDGRGEAEKCAWLCDYYAENAEKFLQLEIIETEASKSFVTFQPIGAVLAVMPWNFPFWQVFRFTSPAIMAGNTVLL
jgi:succinate-semialdehyde dehydrogenase/glutarate-semialdehyde dehydrogenase